MKKTLLMICAAVFLLPCVVGATEASLQGVLDPEDATTYLTDNAASSKIFKGDLVKQGAGETALSLADVHTANGRIVIADGTLAVSGAATANDPGKPWSVLSNAVVWLDASLPETIKFTEGSSVNVGEWRDVRETGAGTAASPYLYMRAVSYTNLGHHATYAPDPNGWFPTYSPAENGENAYVDFGQYSSGRMVYFQDAGGNKKQIKYLRHAFVVLGTHGGHYGFIFNPGDGNAVYVPQSYSSLVNCNLNNFIQSAGGWSILLSGVFRVDGKAIDPSAGKPNGAYQLLDIKTGKTGWQVEGLFSHGVLADAGTGYRQGGGRLCEIILFDRTLNESERLRVEAYLRHKWFGAQVSIPSWTVGEQGSVCLEAGRLDLADPIALSVRGAAMYDATTGGVERTASSGATFVKTGDGELVIGDVASAITKIDVRDGTLRLRQGVSGLIPSNLSGYIEDPSFEAFSDTAVSDTGFSLDSTGKHGWKTYGSHEAGAIAKWKTGGGNFNVAGMPYPDGNYVGILHIRGGLQTTVTLPADGIYKLSYWVAQRPNYKGHEHRVLIDGMPVAEVKAWDSSSNWHRVSFRLPWLSAGEHTLVLASDDNNSTSSRTVNFSVADSIMSTGNLVALVDDFRVDWIESGIGQVEVNNASFEVTSFSARGYEQNPADLGGWEYVSTDGTNYVFLDQTWNDQSRLHPAADGCRILNLVKQVQIGQNITFPAAGTYQLTFAAASTKQDVADYGGKLRFLLADNEIGTLDFGDNGGIMKTYSLPFTVSAGNLSAKLVIASLRERSVVSIDDIRITKAASDSVVEENTFDPAGWSKDEPQSSVRDGAGKVDWMPLADSDAQASWGYVTYGFDSKRVGIRNNASIWRTVTFPSAGVYRLSIASIGRFYRAYGTTDPAMVRLYGGNAFNVWVAKGGVTNVVGMFGVDDCERFVTHRFLFELPEGGDWEVGFSGLKESEHKIAGSNDWHSNGGVLDNLVIEKVTAAAKPSVPNDAEIDVADGATLALDYIGTNVVSSVRHAGRRFSGEISATTCPGFVTGAGALFVQPEGLLIIIR